MNLLQQIEKADTRLNRASIKRDRLREDLRQAFGRLSGPQLARLNDLFIKADTEFNDAFAWWVNLKAVAQIQHGA